MKIDKRLNKLVTDLVKLSFDKNGKLDEKKAASFSKKLVSLPSYQAISALSLFLTRIKEEISKTTLTIESSIEMSSDQLAKIKKALAHERPISNVESHINPSLLGGLKVKIGDMVYDDSIKIKINQVKETIYG